MVKVSKYFNGRKTFYQLAKSNITRKRIPVRVSLQVTKYCNLRCSYCYALLNNQTDVKELSKNEIVNIIDELYGYGTRWILFLGGEPLIRDDIGDIIDYAHRKGIFCELFTNGYFVKNHIKALKKLDSLCISLNGGQEAHELCCGKGSYRVAIDAIEKLLREKISVRLHALLVRHTKNSIGDLIDISEKYNSKFNFAECAPPKKGMIDDSLILSNEEHIEFYKKYKESKKITKTIANTDMAIETMINWPLKDKRTIFKKDIPLITDKRYVIPCELGRKSLCLDVDGSIYPCQERWMDGINVFKHGFKKAWEYLEDLDCVQCKIMGCVEQSLLLKLNWRAFYNSLKNYV